VQSQISNVLLVIGLCSVITWDSTFPDRRDLAVLGPLPVKPRTILLAKLSATCALLGVSILSLNFASSVAWALVFGGISGYVGFARFMVADWFAIVAATMFLYGAVLTVQGLTALLLTRKMFLRLSAVLQLCAFALFLGVYFLLPTLGSYDELTSQSNHGLLAWSPNFWFFAVFNQLNGSLPRELSWLALRAWPALGIVMAGALVSLLLCYLKTMKKTVEQPDLVPGTGGLRWTLSFGSTLHTAIVTFCVRSLVRSRQHRVVFAFFLSLVFAIALAWLRREIAAPAHEPLPTEFLMATFLMMSFTVLGLRAVFSLPISLNANWVLRVTQLQPTSAYMAATRRALLLFAVLPILLLTAALSLHFSPWQHASQHLAILALLGCALVELGLYKFDKVPFTCSYLPGKANIHVIFWGFTLVGSIMALVMAEFEQGALQDAARYLTMAAGLLAAVVGLGVVNRRRAASAVLYFEDLPEEILTRLGLIFVPPAESDRPAAGSGPVT
jgi:hypothetical protein